MCASAEVNSMANDKGGIRTKMLVPGATRRGLGVCVEARAKNVLFIFRARDGLETIVPHCALRCLLPALLE